MLPDGPHPSQLILYFLGAGRGEGNGLLAERVERPVHHGLGPHLEEVPG